QSVCTIKTQGCIKIVRRGFEVFRQVCIACHPAKFIRFRELINVTHTDEEVRKIASEFQYTDGPNDKGEMFERPGTISDNFKSPYINNEVAKISNNGALPPDLSLIVLGRAGHEDYIFSLLTGYCKAPEGIKVEEGQYYNPFMQGGIIAMPPPLYDDIIEYEDGTPATLSQVAKDVSMFLNWASDPHRDKRRKEAYYVFLLGWIPVLCSFYMKRHVWSSVKSNKLYFSKPSKPRYR
ncbi:MAG: iso-1-cytochrome c, partial [Paramarteilia canceri]